MGEITNERDQKLAVLREKREERKILEEIQELERNNEEERV